MLFRMPWCLLILYQHSRPLGDPIDYTDMFGPVESKTYMTVGPDSNFYQGSFLGRDELVSMVSVTKESGYHRLEPGC